MAKSKDETQILGVRAQTQINGNEVIAVIFGPNSEILEAQSTVIEDKALLDVVAQQFHMADEEFVCGTQGVPFYKGMAAEHIGSLIGESWSHLCPRQPTKDALSRFKNATTGR